MFLVDGGEVIAIGGGIEKRVLTRFCVEKAAHGIEFTEVESENFRVTCVLWVWGSKFVSDCLQSNQHHGSASPDSIRMTPTPFPGLTWILYAAERGRHF